MPTRPTRSLRPKIAPTGTISDAVSYRRDFPDGRIGSDPTQSNAADGEKIVAAAAKCLIEDVARFGA